MDERNAILGRIAQHEQKVLDYHKKKVDYTTNIENRAQVLNRDPADEHGSFGAEWLTYLGWCLNQKEQRLHFLQQQVLVVTSHFSVTVLATREYTGESPGADLVAKGWRRTMEFVII